MDYLNLRFSRELDDEISRGVCEDEYKRSGFLSSMFNNQNLVTILVIEPLQRLAVQRAGVIHLVDYLKILEGSWALRASHWSLIVCWTSSVADRDGYDKSPS